MLVMIKVCEAARINYSEMIKFVRRECKCKSKVCLNWECTCMVDDETSERWVTASAHLVTAPAASLARYIQFFTFGSQS